MLLPHPWEKIHVCTLQSHLMVLSDDSKSNLKVKNQISKLYFVAVSSKLLRVAGC